MSPFGVRQPRQLDVGKAHTVATPSLDRAAMEGPVRSDRLPTGNLSGGRVEVELGLVPGDPPVVLQERIDRAFGYVEVLSDLLLLFR
jgi:hypothetical protein